MRFAISFVTDILLFYEEVYRLMSNWEMHQSRLLSREPLNNMSLVLRSFMRPNRSHVGSVVSCVDIIRQGRGSLVTTIEIYKIIALNCLVNAFVLSVRELLVAV